jgi:hypothetical protein
MLLQTCSQRHAMTAQAAANQRRSASVPAVAAPAAVAVAALAVPGRAAAPGFRLSRRRLGDTVSDSESESLSASKTTDRHYHRDGHSATVARRHCQ